LQRDTRKKKRVLGLRRRDFNYSLTCVQNKYETVDLQAFHKGKQQPTS